MANTASAAAIRRDVAELIRPPRRIRASQAAAERMKVVGGDGTIRDWSASATPYMVEPLDCMGSRLYDAVIFAGPARTGKALDVDTPIPTPTGWAAMGDLREGDIVFDEKGEPARVVFCTEYQLDRECYEVEFSDGEKMVADSDHQWGVERFYWKAPNWRYEVASTIDMLRDLLLQEKENGRKRYRYRIRNTAPLQCGEKALPIDPYILGVWLGDGSSCNAYISAHEEDAPHYAARLLSAGHTTTTVADKGNTVTVRADMRTRLTTHCQRGHEFEIVGRATNGGCKECARLGHWRRKYGQDRNGDQIPAPTMFAGTMVSRLRDLGLLHNKHIPKDYLRASFSQRLGLLRGLMDTDGCSDRRSASAEFTTVTPALKDGFVELAASLGLKPRVVNKKTTWNYKGEHKTGSAYRVTFPIPEGFNPFDLPRKASAVKHAKVDVGYRQIVSITRVESRPVKCIQVDSPNSLYLAGRTMIPTHNTNALVDGYVAYKIDCDPGDGLIVQISEEKAREFSKKRIDRMLQNSPALAQRLSPRGHDNNVHDKTFRAGNYLGIKWPSKNVLASSDYQFVLITDFDRLAENIDGEGDAFTLASKRTQTFGSTGMTLAESSPGREITDPDWIRPEGVPHMAPPTTGILDLFNQGDRRLWYWQCPESACRQWFTPTMDHFNQASHRVFCPHCASEIDPKAKRNLNLNGQWVPEGMELTLDGNLIGTRRATRIASFWMEGPSAAFQSWASLAEKLKRAEETFEQTGSQETLKTVINTDWGRPYQYRRAATQRSSQRLLDRAEQIERRTVPHGVRFLTAAVDVQGGKNRRFVVQIHGWGPNREMWVVDRFNIKEDRGPDNDQPPRQISPATQPEDWDLLTRDLLRRSYKLADGSERRMPIAAAAVDTGGEGEGEESVSSQAYEWWRRLAREGLQSRVYLVKGSSSRTPTRVRKTWPDNTGRKDRKSKAKGDVPLYMLGTDQLKDAVAAMMDRDNPGAGYMHTPAWLGRWWYDELTYEIRDPASGKWSRPGKRPNEAFDLCVYNLAVFILLKAESINWEAPPPWAEQWDLNMLITGVDSEPQPEAIKAAVPNRKRRRKVVKPKL